MMSPYEPVSFLVARELERTGIRVNFTCVFSARQALAALLLATPSRISVFLDRIDQGVGLTGLGEDVVHNTQQLIRRHCSELDLVTKLIVANVKKCEQVRSLLECDYFTLSPEVLEGTERAYDAEWKHTPKTSEREQNESATERIEDGRTQYLTETLSLVEADFVDFLLDARSRIARTADPDKLFQMFDDAGYADIFYSPTPDEWKGLGASSLPKDHPDLFSRVPPDTLFSLLAVADFMGGESATWRTLSSKTDSGTESAAVHSRRES